ncbi:ORF6N domain-containing protein [bacterium]|nr:ORF6N domain-containing protein [bacterium]
MAEIIPFERIEQRIYFIRGKKVMLDRDLAELYGVPTKRLNEQVARNSKRFLDDFMFQLNSEECLNLKSQFATSSWGGIRKPPLAFTENGVAMLSGILNSNRAIAVNIQIMRTFTKLRELMSLNKDIFQRLNRHDAHLAKHDKEISNVFDAIQSIMELPITLRRKPKPMGFKTKKDV